MRSLIMKALYDGEVSFADREYGQLMNTLKFLDLYENSLIVFTSDHGEEFGEHRGFDHGRTVYEEMLRVPLIVKFPNQVSAGSVVETAVTGLDIAPTIFRFASMDSIPSQFDGNVLPLPPTQDTHQREIYAEVNPVGSEFAGPVDYQAVKRADLKCIRSLSGKDQFKADIPEWQIFDLSSDPRETTFLASTTELENRCRELIQPWVDSKRTRSWQKGKKVAPKAGLQDRLRALGYVE